MALIDEKTSTFLKNKFAAELDRPVTVELFRNEDNPEATGFAVDLITELSELSPSIRAEIKDLEGLEEDLGITAGPTLLVGRELGYWIEYRGAPLGMEAEGFIDTLVMASKGESGLRPLSVQLLALLEKPVTVSSFVTPTCPHCPRSVMQNHRIALAAPGKVRSVAVEAQQNLEYARSCGVSSVPQQMFDQASESVTIGAQPETAYVEALLAHSGRSSEDIAEAKQAALAELMTLPDRPDHPVEVTDDTVAAAIAKYPFLVVDCWAEWCGPCRMVGPVVEALAKEMQGTAAFAKLDTQTNQATAAQYSIHSIPTLLVFRDGELVERLVGFRPKPALKAALEELLP